MKVFMLGWEFPPYISGGLGTACYGLTKAMDQLDIEVTFVLPRKIDVNHSSHVRLLGSKLPSEVTTFRDNSLTKVKFHAIGSLLQPYTTPQSYIHEFEKNIHCNKQTLLSNTKTEGFVSQGNYSGDMRTEVYRYASLAVELAENENFDVVHAHDWMTYPAGIAVASKTHKPLIVHVHSTEFDRSGEHVNQMIYDIEREGMHAANKVIAVSHLTRNIIISRYGISGEKVEVVHNGVERNGNNDWRTADEFICKDENIVLFLGRMTMQKGPEYFLHAAKKTLEVMSNIKFVMVGDGDMMYRTIEMAASLGIGNKVLFTGFLHGEDVQKIYRMADLYVMPSVSEPFGIAPLEALENDVPVIISKQSGVSEVLNHVLKVDFWDVNEIANKIIAVLKYPPLGITLRNHGNFEMRKLRWVDTAAKCRAIYDELFVSV